MEQEVTPVCINQTSSSSSNIPEILTIEQHTTLADAQPSTHRVTRILPAELNTGRTSSLLQDVKRGRYAAIWCTTPSKKVISEKKWCSHLTFLTRLLLAAIVTSSQFFIIGPLNAAWKEPRVEAMVAGVGARIYYYSLCSFNLTVLPLPENEKSSSRIV